MEKRTKPRRKQEPRPVVQPVPSVFTTSSSSKDIRRQLGWGLVEFARKGALR